MPKSRYSEKKIKKALEACQGGMSLRKTSKIYKIPRSTLTCRLKAKTIQKEIIETDSYLTLEEEDTLVKWIRSKIAKVSHVKKSDFYSFIQTIINKRGKEYPLVDERSQKTWLKSFLRRNPTFATKKPLRVPKVHVNNLNLQRTDLKQHSPKAKTSFGVDQAEMTAKVQSRDVSTLLCSQMSYENPHQNFITSDMEKEIVAWIKSQNDRSVLPTRVNILDKAQAMLKSSGMPIKLTNHRSGNTWFKNFHARHREIGREMKSVGCVRSYVYYLKSSNSALKMSFSRDSDQNLSFPEDNAQNLSSSADRAKKLCFSEESAPKSCFSEESAPKSCFSEESAKHLCFSKEDYSLALRILQQELENNSFKKLLFPSVSCHSKIVDILLTHLNSKLKNCPRDNLTLCKGTFNTLRERKLDKIRCKESGVVEERRTPQNTVNAASREGYYHILCSANSDTKAFVRYPSYNKYRRSRKSRLPYVINAQKYKLLFSKY